MSGRRQVRLVLPHQLFVEHLDDLGEVAAYVLVEHDLLFRQYAFHRQKLVLHRASMQRFRARLEDAGAQVHYVESRADRTSREQLDAVLAGLGERDRLTVTAYDVVDDWLARDLPVDEWRDSPNFLTSTEQLRSYGDPQRMQHFYAWQRRRLDVLMDGDQPVGGRWSFDAENRKKLPRGHAVPSLDSVPCGLEVEDAVAWVREEFPDNPGTLETFGWPTSHEEAERAFEQFLDERFEQFGPYEDAISVEHAHLFHAVLTPALNIGLLSPHRILEAALQRDVPIASLEGFVRQLIGWREYMRAVYVARGRRLRTANHLAHARALPEGWWTADTGLAPVDHCLRRVLETGYAHHIERLMVFGNAMCLLRIDPDAAYEWFMEMFVDAYDWVMVPNVYAMSQFAAGTAITTKPYVSGSNYLRTMSDFGPGEWRADWDALYWTFVRDHHDVFAGNPRAQMIARQYDAMEPAKKAAHTRRAHALIGESGE